VIADEAFFEQLKKDENVRYVVSEERPGLNKRHPVWGDFRGV